MSNFAQLAPSVALPPPVGDGLTGGSLLRRARQAAGLHAEALAATLKVPVNKIEALEADRFDLLPDPVFVRALASSMCRTLGVDARPVLERLPGKAPPRLAQDRERINAPFRGPNDAIGPGWRVHLTRPPVLAVFGLLFAALAIMLVPQSVLDHTVDVLRDRFNDAAPPARSSAVLTAPLSLPDPVSHAQLVPSKPVGMPLAGPASASDAPPMQPDVAAVGSPGSPGGVAADSTSVLLASATSIATEPAPTAAAAAALLVFRARGESWVEVRNAQGAVALRRVLAAGETADIGGAPPLSVTVGKADVTEVQVRGKAFDLAAVSRDNVARFQVK